MSKPITQATPEVGGKRVVSIRTVVVFPAPLGPTTPKISPSFTEKETPSTATLVPNTLLKPSTRRVYAPLSSPFFTKPIPPVARPLQVCSFLAFSFGPYNIQAIQQSHKILIQVIQV